jgi:type I restriction enzyme M protein
MIIRAEFLTSFHKALHSVGLLDRFQIAGALVTWWEELSDEFKTISARGFDELLDGWVDTIKDILDDPESKKEDRDAVREHKLVRRLLPDYLRELEDAAAEVARLDEEKTAFERGPEGEEETEGGDAEEGEEAEARNYAKEREGDWKRLKDSIKDSQLRIKQLTATARSKGSILHTEQKGQDTAPLRDELRKLEESVEPVLQEMAAIEAELEPWWTVCEQLKAARKHLRDLEAALLDRLQIARGDLNPDQGRALVLDLSREVLAQTLAASVTAHRQKVTAAVENLWDKYRVSLDQREKKRADVSKRLTDMLGGLGYE